MGKYSDAETIGSLMALLEMAGVFNEDEIIQCFEKGNEYILEITKEKCINLRNKGLN